MKHYIDSYGIKQHNKILAESVSSTPTDKCELLYRLVEEKKNYDTDMAFFKECSKSSANTNLWLETCLDIMQVRPNATLLSYFKESILPLAGIQYVSRTINSHVYDENTTNMLQNYYNITLAKEQVQNFHEAIVKQDDKIEEIAKEHYDFYNLINRCCYDVDRLTGADYPVANKIIASVNESLYLLQDSSNYENSMELSVIKEVLNYFFSMSYQNAGASKFIAEDYELAIKGLSRDPMLSQYYNEAFDSTNLERDLDKNIYGSSLIGKACDVYLTNVTELVTIKNTVVNASDYDIINNFNSFLVLLEKFIYNADESYEVTKYIIEKLIPTLYQDIFDNIITKRTKARTIIQAIIDALNSSIWRMNNLLKAPSNNTNIDYIIQFKNEVELLVNQLTNGLDFIYTEYAYDCATGTTLNEGFNTITTLNEFKIFKFDNLVTRCYKLDKYLQNKFNQFKEKFKASIKKASDKIFNEYSVYDMIDEDGNLDFCIASYDISNINNFSEYHEFCTKLIKEMNQDCSEGTVYYQVNPDTLEFRIRENYNLQLTEEEVNMIEHTMSDEDMNRIRLITMCSQLYREDYDYIEESKEFFKKNYSKEVFQTYLEACSLAGVPKETVHDIYVSLVDYHGSSFAIDNCFAMGEYNTESVSPEVAMEAAGVIEYMLEADKPLTDRQKANRERMNAKLAQWEKEEEEADNKKKTTNNEKPANNTIQQNNSQDQQKKDTADKGGTGGLVKIANRLKIYLHGIRGAYKKADAKTKTAIKNMDAGVARFFKGIKQALVSDRREAIIKGSVIPSFHKCILIAATFAGVAYFNMPLAIIGAIAGFAASKKLTKKERALLYDDIMIEIRIIEKEIQKAEDKNQMKKLRELLKMKRELERQAARIQYNIRVGKDIIPGGRYSAEDD